MCVHLSYKRSSYLFVVLWIMSLLLLTSVVKYTLDTSYSNALRERSDKARVAALMVEGVANFYRHKVTAKELSQEEAQREFLKPLADIRYGVDGGLWVTDAEGVVKYHTNATFVGRNIKNIPFLAGDKIMAQIPKDAPEGAFIDPTSGVYAHHEVSPIYVVTVKDWGWNIGVGVSMGKLENSQHGAYLTLCAFLIFYGVLSLCLMKYLLIFNRDKTAVDLGVVPR